MVSSSLYPFLAGAAGVSGVILGTDLVSRYNSNRDKGGFEDLWNAVKAWELSKTDQNKNSVIYEAIRAHKKDNFVQWTSVPKDKQDAFGAVVKKIDTELNSGKIAQSKALFLPFAAGALSAGTVGFAVTYQMLDVRAAVRKYAKNGQSDAESMFNFSTMLCCICGTKRLTSSILMQREFWDTKFNELVEAAKAASSGGGKEKTAPAKSDAAGGVGGGGAAAAPAGGTNAARPGGGGKKKGSDSDDDSDN